MRQASTAYPRVANRTYIKYVAVVGVLLFLIGGLLHSDDEPNDGSDSNIANAGASGAAANPRLRGPVTGYAKLSELLAVGLGLTDQAAQVIKDVKYGHKEESRVKGMTKEGVEEPVTVADTMSNKVFVNGYRNHFSGITMLSEETEPDKDDSGVNSLQLPADMKLEVDLTLDLSKVLVIVDPLDATKEFGEGVGENGENLLPYVTTMVCVVYDGKPIAGIINQVFAENKPVVGVVPQEKEGLRGEVFNRERKEPVSEGAAHTVTISRSHTGDGGNVVEKYLEGHSVLMAGGAGYKSLLVLDGNAEAYIHVTAIKSWDVCAAEAVLKAGGGDFTDITGKPLIYSSDHDNALFTNGIIATAWRDKHHFFVEKLDGNLT